MKPRLRLFADPAATVPLRFDDPEFLAALEADDANRAEGSRQGPLAQILGVPRATDYDFTEFAVDGWTIHARGAITGHEEDALMTDGQRAGGGVDIGAVNRTWWASWVARVSLPDGAADELDRQDRAVLAELCSSNKKARGDGFAKLPTLIRDGFRARLRVHVDAVSRPADRDPGKTADPTVAASRGTGHSFNGDHDPS